MNKLLLWIKITRPGTLFAAITPVVVALLLVAKVYHHINWLVGAVTLFAAIMIQVASNMINDLYDYKKGLDESGRVGPSRALAENRVSVKAMRNAIFLVLLFAVISGFYLFLVGGLPILIIGVAALFFAWLYTATRYSLSYLGVADIFVFLFFGPVATAGTVYLQSSASGYDVVDIFTSGIQDAMIGHLLPGSIAIGIITGLISMAVLTVNNIRDLETDKQSGKKTLPVRIGKFFAELEYLILFLIIIPCLIHIHAFFLTYAVVLYGIFLYSLLRRAKGKEYNSLLVLTGMGNILFGLLYAIDLFAR